jgi:hypothetical protein
MASTWPAECRVDDSTSANCGIIDEGTVKLETCRQLDLSYMQRWVTVQGTGQVYRAAAPFSAPRVLDTMINRQKARSGEKKSAPTVQQHFHQGLSACYHCFAQGRRQL